LLIKAKQQHGKNENKNTGLFINCMDFVVVRTKIKSSFFFCYAWALIPPLYSIWSEVRPVKGPAIAIQSMEEKVEENKQLKNYRSNQMF
jgi:hypothetical protein